MNNPLPATKLAFPYADRHWHHRVVRRSGRLNGKRYQFGQEYIEASYTHYTPEMRGAYAMIRCYDENDGTKYTLKPVLINPIPWDTYTEIKE
jgi:hypothetical protein